MATLQSVRGMRDLLPGELLLWRTVENAAQRVLESFGYAEIRLPLVEPTDLFSRGVGEATDIVGKEMYSFEDRDGGGLTLRPEGTAGVVRAGLQHGLLFNQVQRFWYSGPMFRYEKPQKGRYRQFEQIGAEAFGIPGPENDAELIQIGALIFDSLGVRSRVTLELNTLGSPEARAAYRAALVAYLEPHKGELDADSQTRLARNPLRILDSKVTSTLTVLEGAPDMANYLDAAAVARFDDLRALLDALGIEFTLNRRLVRGLDYYTHTVFEWVTNDLGSQGAVCSGGRYDGLVTQLGGKKPTPGAGFAFGTDRLVHLVEANRSGNNEPPPRSVDVYCIALDSASHARTLKLAQRLRDSGLAVRTQALSGKFDAELKRATESGAVAALVVSGANDDEPVRLKWLRDGGSDERLNTHAVVEALAKLRRGVAR